MFQGWRRFLALPDADRARLLIRIAAGIVIVFLYSLGGLSLYLRARYLGPATPTPVQQAVATQPSEQEPTIAQPAAQEAATWTLSPPTATLFPTMTPAVEQPSIAPTVTSLPPIATANPSETPFPSPTTQPTVTPPPPTPTETEPPATATPTAPPLGPPPTRVGT